MLRDQVDGLTNETYSRRGGILGVSLNFASCEEFEKMQAPDFFQDKLDKSILSGVWKVLSGTGILYKFKVFTRKFH